MTSTVITLRFSMYIQITPSLKIGSDLYILGLGIIWLVRSTGAACACCL